MEKKLRTSSSSEEIYKYFRLLRITRSLFVVWQNINGKRVSSRAEVLRLNNAKRAVIISLVEDEENEEVFDFDKEFSLFISSETYSMLCKANLAGQQDSLLIVKMPNEAMLLEKRTSPRLLKRDLKCGNIAIKVQIPGKTYINLTINFLDFSMDGFAFKTNEKDGDYFFQNTQVLIISIDQKKLKEPIVARVKYKNENSIMTYNVKKACYRIGAEFINEVDNELLDMVLGKKELKKVG